MLENKWLNRILVVSIILLPLGLWWLYQSATGLPEKTDIASGPTDGQFHPVAEDLASLVGKELTGRAENIPTDGSAKNFELLRTGQVDFGLYQPGVAKTLNLGQADNIRFVASLYLQPLHLFVRAGSPADGKDLTLTLKGAKIATGLAQSGDHAMSLVLLEHLGLATDYKEFAPTGKEGYYESVLKEFQNETLDAAIIAIGEDSEIFQRLSNSGKCKIRSIPNVEAFARKHDFLTPFTIPSGRYGRPPNAIPECPVKTVAAGAQLLTRRDVNPKLVKLVTNVVLDRHFQTNNKLRELSAEGMRFANSNSEFPIHPGARTVYEPDFDIKLIESFDAAYSLSASAFLMALFGFRWFRKKQERKREHKLDRYIRSLLEIELRQMADDHGATHDQANQLQKLLDEITVLRQEALGELSAHELNEDQGTDCFINMSHALSSEINAKLTRIYFELSTEKLLGKAIKSATSTPDDNRSE